MTIDEAIAELFRRKINCGCEIFVDAGIRLWIADVMNDRRAETQLPRERLAESGQWLVDAARRLCPENFLGPGSCRSDSPRQDFTRFALTPTPAADEGSFVPASIVLQRLHDAAPADHFPLADGQPAARAIPRALQLRCTSLLRARKTAGQKARRFSDGQARLELYRNARPAAFVDHRRRLVAVIVRRAVDDRRRLIVVAVSVIVAIAGCPACHWPLPYQRALAGPARAARASIAPSARPAAVLVCLM